MGAHNFNGTVGLRRKQDLMVTYEHTAAHASGGILPAVLSTPRLLHLVEEATAELAAPHLERGWVSVGYQVLVEHVAPSQVGDVVTAEVVLEAAEDRDLIFRFTVHDKDGLREVGRGTQTRKIVLMDDFMAKLKQERIA